MTDTETSSTPVAGIEAAPTPIAETAKAIAAIASLSAAEANEIRDTVTGQGSVSLAQRRAQHARVAATLKPAGYDDLIAEKNAAAGKVAAAEAAMREAQDRVAHYQRLVEVAAALDARHAGTVRQLGILDANIARNRTTLIEHSEDVGGHFHPIEFAIQLAGAVIGRGELEAAAAAIAKLAEDALTAAEEYAAANGIAAPTE